MKRALALILLLLTVACGRPAESPEASEGTPSPGPAAPAAATVDLREPGFTPAAAGQPDWAYVRTATADLDGDRTDERAVLLANVSLYQGEPLWEDGHRWQLYIEEPGGTRTYLYARFLPFGRLEASVVQGEAGATPALLLIEETPQELSVYEIRYAAPERFEAVRHLRRERDPRRGFSAPP